MAKSTPALSLSDFEAAEQSPGSKCWFSVRLTPEQQDIITQAVGAGRSYAAVSRVLASKLDIHINGAQVRHHFTGMCRCGR